MSKGAFERGLNGESKRKVGRVMSGIGVVQRDFIGMVSSLFLSWSEKNYVDEGLPAQFLYYRDGFLYQRTVLDTRSVQGSGLQIDREMRS